MSRLGDLFEKFRPATPASREQPVSEADLNRWVVMGLGNPTEQYRRSRHNIGFMTVRHLAAKYHGELNRRKFNGRYTELRTDDGIIVLVQPQTYYNRSGECASAMLGYYKVPPERLIVMHDEMDLPERQIRLKRGGSDAGNRGVRSIAEALATPDFIRVRIGVAHPPGRDDSIDYLLRPLTSEELESFVPIFDRAADAVGAIMREGLERARSVYNQRV